MGCGASAEQNDQENNNNNQQDDNEIDEDLQFELENQEGQYDSMEKKKKDDNDGDLFGVAEDESNEQFMATKPWIGALVAPTEAPEVDVENAPEKQLELEYVNGYRCEDSRQNLYFTSDSNKVVFMSAAIGVVQDLPSNTQTFFGAGKVGEAVGHNDDIEALHVCPERKLCATGQRGKNPSIFIWDIEGKNVIHSFKQGRNSRAVRQLKFSKDGKFIFTCDISNDHVLHIWDVESGQKVASEKTGNDQVYDMDTAPSGGFAGAIATKRGIKFIRWNGGSMVELKTGMKARAFMVSCTFFEDGTRMAAGSTKGDIYIFNGQSAMKTVAIHSGGIHAISIQEGKLLTSGYRDKTLKIHNSDTLTVQAEHQLPCYARSLDYKDGKVILGTRDGQIYHIDAEGNMTLVLDGHGTGEAWGLDLTPEGNIVTTGDDNKIVSFDVSKNQTVATGIVNPKAGRKHRIGGASTLSRYPPNQCSRSVAVHPSNGQVAIASNEGELSIRNSTGDLDGFVMNIKRVAKEWIEVMAYSPDGKYLAVGTHSRDILILDVENNYDQVGKCTKHNAAILNIDWSLDSTVIRSVCNAYELLFFSTDGSQLTDGASSYRDEEFATQSCKLGWWVQGIFPPATDGSHVNGVARNNGKDVIATGDDWGFVNLYKNPNIKGSKCHSYRAHSSHVVRVKFNADDSYLYSIGGYDRCLMKWKVI